MSLIDFIIIILCLFFVMSIFKFFEKGLKSFFDNLIHGRFK